MLIHQIICCVAPALSEICRHCSAWAENQWFFGVWWAHCLSSYWQGAASSIHSSTSPLHFNTAVCVRCGGGSQRALESCSINAALRWRMLECHKSTRPINGLRGAHIYLIIYLFNRFFISCSAPCKTKKNCISTGRCWKQKVIYYYINVLECSENMSSLWRNKTTHCIKKCWYKCSCNLKYTKIITARLADFGHWLSWLPLLNMHAAVGAPSGVK